MNKTTLKLIALGAVVAAAVLALQLATPGQASATTVCSGGSCSYVACTTSADCGTNQFTPGQYCSGNNVYQNYITYTCNNPGTADSSCTRATTPRFERSCDQYQGCRYGSCVSPDYGSTTDSATTTTPSYGYFQTSYQRCSGNAVWAFNSYNQAQYLVQTCAGGQTCVNNACQTSYIFHSYKGCENSNLYWYDSNGSRVDLYQNCATSGQTCQNGQCMISQAVVQAPVQPSYTAHAKTGCYNQNMHWYDSKGIVQDIYKSCDDKNQCTIDNCEAGACTHVLRCDGSTCGQDSPDWMSSCQNQTTSARYGNLVITLVAKKGETGFDFARTISVTKDIPMIFLVTVKNLAATPVTDTNVSLSTTAALQYANNLTIDGMPSGSTISNGLALGTIDGHGAKAISFGATINSQNSATLTASVKSPTSFDSDTLVIGQTSIPAQATTASIQDAGIIGFAKQWYLWITVIIALIGLFIVIFRRLSAKI